MSFWGWGCSLCSLLKLGYLFCWWIVFFFLFEIIITFPLSFFPNPYPHHWHWTTNWRASPRKTPLLSSFPQSHILFSVGLRPHGSSPSTLACPLVQYLLSSCLGSHVVNLHGCSFWHDSGTLSLQTVILWLLQSFSPLFQCFLSPRSRCMDQLHSAAFWLVVVFGSGIYLCVYGEIPILLGIMLV